MSARGPWYWCYAFVDPDIPFEIVRRGAGLGVYYTHEVRCGNQVVALVNKREIPLDDEEILALCEIRGMGLGWAPGSGRE